MAGILLPGSARGGSGDIEGVTAGDGLSGGGTSGSVTLNLDLSGLSDVTPANGDKLATIDSDGANEQLTTVASLATLFAGTGLTASSSVISVDDSTASAKGAVIVAGGTGISVSYSSGTATVAGSDASTSAKGIAQFSSDNFAASSGTITIKDGGVVTAELAADAVTSAKLADDAVVTAKITDANVTLAKIANSAANTVIVRDANSSGVLSAKAVADTQLLIGDGTGFTAATLSGDVSMANTGAVTIANDAVETAMIADNQVTAAKLFDLAQGSILYGNASAATAELTKGSANTVLTSDGTDISWAAAGGGGLVEYDIWSLSSDGSDTTEAALDTNLIRWAPSIDSENAFEKIGTGMSKSSGNFTFPSTGKYEVIAQASYSGQSGGNDQVYAKIHHTVNSTSATVVRGAAYRQGSSETSVMAGPVLLDIRDTSDTVQFEIESHDAYGGVVKGNATILYTFIAFKKIGDT